MPTRRQFLCFASGSMTLGTAAWLLNRTGELTPAKLSAVTRKSWALGSYVSITARHANPDVAASAVDAAFSALELVEQLMSIYRPQSQLCQLNQAGVLDNPHPDFVEVLNAASDMSQRSEGAFDITVQPLWDLFSNHRQLSTLPDTNALELAKQRVDWRRVEVTSRRIRLHARGTAITLNGIAQGYATDKALAALRSHGVTQALLNTGEIASVGSNDQGQPWTVGIQHPRHADAYLSLTKLDGRCLATSGDYATSFSDDYRFHHIFDPRTGQSPAELASVSIAAESAMQADALSTAVFVLGPERGSSLVRSTPGADALLVLKDGRTLRTPGFGLEGVPG